MHVLFKKKKKGVVFFCVCVLNPVRRHIHKYLECPSPAVMIVQFSVAN